MRRALLLVLLSSLSACSGDEGDAPTTSIAALTAEQCTFFAVDDKVTICHRTSSAKNPYTVIRTNRAGCAEGHTGHIGDYVSTTDPTCRSLGCYPEGAPADSLVPCCGGDPIDGRCPPVDACVEFPCEPHERCVDLPAPALGDKSGRECHAVCYPEGSETDGALPCCEGLVAEHGVCVVPTSHCGDGVVEGDEQCDLGTDAEGNSLNGTQPCGCGKACRMPQKGTPCDDGSPCTTDDYCSGEGECWGQNACAGGEVCTKKGCVAEDGGSCGDGALDKGETCDGHVFADDKNDCADWGRGQGEVRCFDPEDAKAPCQIDFGGCACGNGLPDPGEQCDDGTFANGRKGSCCRADCTFAPSDQSCDDRDFCTESDLCDGAGQCVGSGDPCQGGKCDSQASQCRTCGDGVVQTESGEACDDGDDNGASPCGCTTECQPSSACASGERCVVDAGLPGGYGCEVTCGNGIVDAGEVCDGTNTGLAYFCMNGNGAATCAADCQSVTPPDPVFQCTLWQLGCGNGFRNVGEQCDGGDLGGVDCAYLGFVNPSGALRVDGGRLAPVLVQPLDGGAGRHHALSSQLPPTSVSRAAAQSGIASNVIESP